MLGLVGVVLVLVLALFYEYYVHKYCGRPVLNTESCRPVVPIGRELRLLGTLHRDPRHGAGRGEGGQGH